MDRLISILVFLFGLALYVAFFTIPIWKGTH